MVRRRPGFTLLEMVVVMAILVVLAGILVPTIAGVRGNTGLKAGGDTLRSKMFDARAKAMDYGIPYRLSVSDDGKTLQVAPDDATAAADLGQSGNPSQEKMPDGIIVKVLPQDGVEATVDQTGWIRVATFSPEGTCREDLVEVQVIEAENKVAVPITIRIRGVTGAIRIVKSGAKK